MRVLPIEQLSDTQKRDIVDIWNSEYPAHIGHKHVSDFDSYLSELGSPKHLVICNQEGTLLGWLSTFDRNDERWFSMLLHASLQGQGYGRRLLDAAKTFETEINGWATDHDRDVKANGQPYPSPIGFYLKNDFTILSDVRLEKGPLSTVKIRWRAKTWLPTTP